MRSEGYGSWVCVCVSVVPLSHISPLERLFVLKLLSHTQRATKFKKFVRFSLKLLRSGNPALPHLRSYVYTGGHFFGMHAHALTNEDPSTCSACARAHATVPRVCTLVPFITSSTIRPIMSFICNGACNAPATKDGTGISG